jgi:hypothetical protein
MHRYAGHVTAARCAAMAACLSVPAAELDATMEALAEWLLKRNAYGIAWTKRVLNQRLPAAYNNPFDAGISCEFLTNTSSPSMARRRPAVGAARVRSRVCADRTGRTLSIVQRASHLGWFIVACSDFTWCSQPNAWLTAAVSEAGA